MYAHVDLRDTKQTMGITHVRFFITDHFLVTQGEDELDLIDMY